MTTQEKTAAIRTILTNHQDNDAARKNAGIAAGLESYVIQAMNKAMMDDLALVFAAKINPAGKD